MSFLSSTVMFEDGTEYDVIQHPNGNVQYVRTYKLGGRERKARRKRNKKNKNRGGW